MVKMETIDELLKRGREVTDNYKNAGHKWNKHSQLLKIYEEVAELHAGNKGVVGPYSLEEGCDIIYAVLTYFHITDFSDEIIKYQLEQTMRKIEQRSEKALVNQMEKQSV